MLVSCTFDIEEKTKKQIEKIAEENYRSLSAQLRMMLEEVIEGNPKY